MEHLALSELFAVASLFLTIFGVWYKINQDTDSKLKDLHDSFHADNEKVRKSLEDLRVTAMTRVEHVQDVEKVRDELKRFRDEVREDIRTMNSNISSRLDQVLQHVYDIGRGMKP